MLFGKINKQVDQAPNTNIVPFRLTSQIILLLIICQLMNLLTLSLELSWWMLSIITICLGWQVLILKDITQKPNKILVGILSVSGCVLLAISAVSLGLLSTMLHLLCLSYVLKSFELNKRTDFYQMILLGIFVLVSSLIFQQSLYFVLVLSIIIILNFTLLVQYFAPNISNKGKVNVAAKLFMQSAPLAIVLFFVFPKLSPLWAVPTAKSAQTGLSDSVKVGDIANLALSDELAFRVKFEGSVPQYSQMYWRAIVMENFDGNSWTTGTEKALLENYNPFRKHQDSLNVIYQYKFDQSQAKGAQLNYQVITSPTYQHWLFGLDLARVDNSKVKSNTIYHRQDYSLYSKEPITQNMSYNVTSYIEQPLALLISDNSYQRNINIPISSNPKLVNKANELRQQFDDTTGGNEQLIQTVLSTFNKDIYRYTLNAPRLQNNSLDQFYFETKAGFCEHFASSFTFLMRAAGIPSRLVTGYMGGEYNSRGAYFSVYQRDAHAWSEVWLEGKGWIRVDPTAYINPERVERGFSQELLKEQAASSLDAFSLLRVSQNNAFINNIRLQLEALDYNWTRWVIGYTANKQNQFLQNLYNAIKSLKEINLFTLTYYLMLTIIILLLVWWLVKINHARKPKSNSYYYQQVILLFNKHGLTKPVKMTPKDFVLIVKAELPELAVEFAKFTDLYTSLEYKALSEQQHKTLSRAFGKSFKVIKIKL